MEPLWPGSRPVHPQAMEDCPDDVREDMWNNFQSVIINLYYLKVDPFQSRNLDPQPVPVLAKRVIQTSNRTCKHKYQNHVQL